MQIDGQGSPFFTLEQQFKDLVQAAENRASYLNGAEANIVRAYSQQAEALYQGLSAVLSRVLQHDPASAIQIAAYVGGLLQHAFGIGHMNTAPTVSARTRLRSAATERGRDANLNTPTAKARDDAFNLALPPDWQSWNPRKLNAHMLSAANRILELRNEVPFEKPAMQKRLRNLRKNARS